MRSKRSWDQAAVKVVEEGRCRSCGAVGALDPAHVIPRSAVKPGPGEDPRNVIPLCRACHNATHHQLLELLPLLSLEEQAYAVGLVGIERARRYTTVRGESNG
jgi:5-methylcytosine-specific restriction endonuclease McrA